VDGEEAHLRIGELSRRVGVSPELLRAWERRYGLLQPTRSEGGFRLYSNADEERIRAMQLRLEGGLSAAQAAAAVLLGSEAVEVTAPDLSGSRAGLLDALERYDEATANAFFDRLLATFDTDTVLVEVVLPVLRSLGEGWMEGRITIAQEHFASSVLRGRLLGLARGWGRGTGPVAVLACPSGEQHDLPLLLFGIALREAGWRITFLGADTPIATIERAAASVPASAVVLSAVTPERLNAVESELTALASRTRVAIGGAGAEPELAERAGAVFLQGDPIAGATGFARSFHA
jgi:MerR family transcriptional regulator, light-induced transcriptional regulator